MLCLLSMNLYIVYLLSISVTVDICVVYSIDSTFVAAGSGRLFSSSYAHSGARSYPKRIFHPNYFGALCVIGLRSR